MYKGSNRFSLIILDAAIQVEFPTQNNRWKLANAAHELRNYLRSRISHERRVFFRPTLSPLNAVRAHLADPILRPNRADAFVRLQARTLEKMSAGLVLGAIEAEFLLEFLLELHTQLLNELSKDRIRKRSFVD
jgi:hypothetical protein